MEVGSRVDWTIRQDRCLGLELRCCDRITLVRLLILRGCAPGSQEEASSRAVNPIWEGGLPPEPGTPFGMGAHGSYKREEETAAGGGREKNSFVFPCFWDVEQ